MSPPRHSGSQELSIEETDEYEPRWNAFKNLLALSSPPKAE